MVEHIHFRVRVALCDLVQHDGGGLHGGGGGPVTVSRDQSIIVDICRAKGGFSVGKIIEPHLDADDIRLFPGVFTGVIVELHAAVHIGTHGSGAIEKNGAS